MISPQGVRRYYESRRLALEQLQARVHEILFEFASGNGLLFTDRIKSLDSLAEKVESGRYDSFDGIDDLYAATIVVASPGEHDAALEFVRSSLIVHREKVKLHGRSNPEMFEFDGTRIYCSVEYPPSLGGLVFEVQVVSAFEHAWSRTTHAITYKADQVDWRRVRASSMLRALADQADLIVGSFDQFADLLGNGSWPVLDDRAEIVKRFRTLANSGDIPAEVVPSSWTRFSENFHRLVRALAGSKRVQYPTDEQVDAVSEALEVIESVAAGSPHSFPLSLSLLQSCIGILLSSDSFPKKTIRVTDYSPPISQELIDFFPNVADHSWPRRSPLMGD